MKALRVLPRPPASTTAIASCAEASRSSSVCSDTMAHQLNVPELTTHSSATEHDFYRTPAGRKYFADQIQSIAYCTQE